MSETFSRDKKRALTLLELLVVVAILALITATVSTRLENTVGPAALGQATAQWEFADQQLRLHARRNGTPTAMQLSAGSSRIECTFDSNTSERSTIRTLGRSVRLTKFVSATQEVTQGPVSIRYDERGASETFAIELAGGRGLRRWLFVAGITGQITEVANEAAAREILEILSPPSVHAG